MKLPVQIIESSPVENKPPHFIISPDYIMMELTSGSWIWEAHMVLLINLREASAFREFERRVKDMLGRFSEFEVRVPINKPSSSESKTSFRILYFKECIDIKFELDSKDAPSKEELFVDIDFKALLMNSEVRNFNYGQDYRVDKTMQTLSESNK